MTMQAEAGRELLSLSSFNPFGPHVTTMYSYFEQARRTEPVFFSDAIQAWCVARYDDIRSVLADPVTFSSQEAFPRLTGLPDSAQRATDFLFDNLPITMLDPPHHAPVRKIAHRGFGPHIIAGFAPAVREIIADYVDRLPRTGRFDLVSQFCEPFPLAVGMRVIGFPQESFDDLYRWTGNLASIVLGGSLLGDEELSQHGDSYAKGIDWLIRLVESRRAAPQNDLISIMVDQKCPESTLTDSQAANLAIGLLTAGWHTTGNTMTNTVHTLMRERRHWKDLVNGWLMPDAVMAEGIRHDSPVIGMFRVATRNTIVAGREVRAGDKLLLLFASANHDETYFADPGTFDPARFRKVSDLTFGHGIHNCLGAPLARLELSIALELLAARFPNLSLASQEPLQFKPLGQFKGPTALWLTA